MSTALIIAGCVLGYTTVGFACAVTEVRTDGEHDLLPLPLWLAAWPVFLPLWLLFVSPVLRLHNPAVAVARRLHARAERKRLPSAKVVNDKQV